MNTIGTMLEDKCMKFAIRIVKLCRFINEEKREYKMADQLFRSGTSIGANVAEAQCAQSKKDFIAKTYISLKECNESLYWLKLLWETELLDDRQYDSINADCLELKRLLVAITKTATINTKRKKSVASNNPTSQHSTLNTQQ